jgi:hypothetical protein
MGVLRFVKMEAVRSSETLVSYRGIHDGTFHPEDGGSMDL